MRRLLHLLFSVGDLIIRMKQDELVVRSDDARQLTSLLISKRISILTNIPSQTFPKYSFSNNQPNSIES